MPLAADSGKKHPNNFDAIRIAAALAVLVSHHFALTGQAEPAVFGLHTLGGLAVMVFFVISGYLITASWYNDPHVLRFSLRRILRIWPALTMVVVVTAYGLGAWVTQLPLMEYWQHAATLSYLRTIAMQVHYMLPGVFETNPYAQSVNGSLWTIPLEVRCYIVMAAAAMLGLMRSKKVWLLCITSFMVWFLFKGSADVTGKQHYGRELSAFFLAGCALYVLHPLWEKKPWFWIAGLAIGSALLWWVNWRYTAMLLLLPFSVIYFGTRSTPILRRFGRWGDPSYGTYLIAFPVQQAVLFFWWPEAGFLGTLALAILITLVLAYASWHLLEKQALKLKPARRQPVSGTNIFRKARDSFGHYKSAAWFWPLLAGIVGLRFIIKRLDAPILVDSASTYLPAARAFLEQGWSFLLTPQSYQVTPLAYLWPALWGADPTWIRFANMGLWIGCVWFLWRTCCLLGGLRAGAVAMLLLILSPELVRYFPTEMTEPLYLFGLFGWMHAMARIVICNEKSLAVIAQGALMLATTLLSRPVLQLIVPAALLACLCYFSYRSVRGKGMHTAWTESVSAVAFSLGLALILPIALVIKNGTVFGLWGLGTGSGIGLYLGTHPLFQGAEPDFLGFDFDVNILVALATQSGSPLSLAGDRVTHQAAFWHLQSMSMADSAAFFARKLWWWLAHHPAQIETFGASLRKLRFFELLFLISAIAWLVKGRLLRGRATPPAPNFGTARQWVFAAFLLAMFLAMLIQLLPLLYNSRYSSTLLDPWLILLTAFGVARLSAPIEFKGVFKKNHWTIEFTAHPGASLWSATATLAVLLATTFVAYDLIKKHESNVIDPQHIGLTRTHFEISDREEIETQGMEFLGGNNWIVTATPAVIQAKIDADDVERFNSASLFNAMWETDIALQTNAGRCQKAETSYQSTDGRIFQPRYKRPLLLPLQSDGAFHPLVTHANHEMRPREPGSFRVVVHCPIGTIVKWRRTRLLESLHASDAAAHIKP